MSRSGMVHTCPTCGNLKDATAKNCSTIAEPEKRIGELEAEKNDWRDAAELSEQERTAERRRREEAEAALREWEEWGDYPYRDPNDLEYNPTRAHFRKYEASNG